jgi:hypothetical protein
MTSDLLADLIADAQQIVLPKPRVVEPNAPQPPAVIRIPETTASLVDGYDDYGS